MTTPPHDERGFVLVAVLMLSTLLVAMGTAGLLQTRSDLQMTSNVVTGAQAFHIAEAGLQHAWVLLDDDGFFDDLYSDQGGTVLPSSSFGAGEYRVSATTVPGSPKRTLRVVSVGTGPDDARREIEALFQQTDGAAVKRALLAGGRVVIKGTAQITGDCGRAHANGRMKLKGKPLIEDSATSSGKFKDKIHPSCSSDPSCGLGNPGSSGKVDDTVDVPEIDPSMLKGLGDYELQPDCTVIDHTGTLGTGKGKKGVIDAKDMPGKWKCKKGRWTVKPGKEQPLDGTYYVAGKKGQLRVRPAKGQGIGTPDAPWEASVIAEGQVTIAGKKTHHMTPAADDLFVVADKVRVNGKLEMAEAGLLMAKRRFAAGKNAKLKGAVVVENGNGKTKLKGKFQLEYDCGLSQPFGGESEAVLVSWRDDF